MKIDEVPNDAGKLDGEKELCYAEDEQGHYTAVQSEGWVAKNITLDQAWSFIHEELNQVKENIRQGKFSNLAYYMALNQMDVKLLSEYSGFSKHRIRRHLKPDVFLGLNRKILEVYAWLFKISMEELQALNMD